MTGYSLYMGSGPILFAGFAQGFGLGCTFVPLKRPVRAARADWPLSVRSGDFHCDARE
jgi:hypothetical protein